MKFKIGDCVRVGGKLGCIMIIKDINGPDMVLVDGLSTFYFHQGDCSLYLVPSFEQLTLF